MSTSTEIVPIVSDAYTNVSNGNLNAIIFVPGSVSLRVHIGGELPEPDTDKYILMGFSPDHRSFNVNDLEAEDDIYLMVEGEGSTSLKVIRGTAKISLIMG